MLTLARKVGECIVIGDNIRLQVLEISGDRVKLGVSAPKEVTVDRAERVPFKTEGTVSKPTTLPPTNPSGVPSPAPSDIDPKPKKGT